MRDWIRQVPVNELEGEYYPQAMLRGSPESMARSMKVQFEHNTDELDGFEAAALRLEPVATGKTAAGFLPSVAMGLPVGLLPGLRSATSPTLMFLMQRYGREPAGQLTVLLPARLAAPGDVSAAVARILDASHLDAGSLIWQRSDDPRL